VELLGSRIYTKGQERLLLTGTLTDANGATQVQLLYEVPGRLRLDLQGGSGKTLIFDGASSRAASGSLTTADEDLLESFAGDSADGLLAAIKAGAHLRIVGQRFRADDGTTPNYQGPWYDVYQLTAPARQRGAAGLVSKWFYFDSVTGLLDRVRYAGQSAGSQTIVETHFDDWLNEAGQNLPGRITRIENGAEVFAFVRTGATLGPRQNDGLFTQSE
jgi:hypothetical protein